MIVVIIGFVFVLSLVLYLKLNPEFGGVANKEEREAFSRSERWNGKVFRNYLPTSTDIGLKDLPGLLKKQFGGTADRFPPSPLEIEKFDMKSWKEDDSDIKFIWYGHSVLLFRFGATNVLIDPMFGPDASPIAPVSTRRFSENTLEIIDQLPFMDIVVFTHDHYDHLDYNSIQRIKNKVGLFVVPLGFSAHLLRWGVHAVNIHEMDWYESFHRVGINFTFTPTRHYSGRSLLDRAKSLWGGWVMEYNSKKIYVSGDGGYGGHFKDIGNKMGPFDLAFVECGQYNKLWRQIHLFPEDAIQVVEDVGARITIPIHWGSFVLAHHKWNESAHAFSNLATARGHDYGLPLLGEIYTIDCLPNDKRWFEESELEKTEVR